MALLIMQKEWQLIIGNNIRRIDAEPSKTGKLLTGRNNINNQFCKKQQFWKINKEEKKMKQMWDQIDGWREQWLG